MIALSPETVLRLHARMLEATGGAAGILDEGALHSAVLNAYATFDGADLYPGIEDKAAATAYGIVANHPFADGNKRTGLFAMLVLLEVNGILLRHTQQELIDLGLGIASGIIRQKDIAQWIRSHRE